MSNNKRSSFDIVYLVAAFAIVCVLALGIGVSGCGGGNGGTGGTGGGGGGGGGGTMPTCSSNPMSHEEIINACTEAQAVDITPFFPASAPNGTLPPLPN